MSCRSRDCANAIAVCITWRHSSGRPEGVHQGGRGRGGLCGVDHVGVGGLERNAIGLTEVLFQSITHMAPAVATALSIGAATPVAGGNTPLAVVLALIAVLFTAYSMGELARHLPSAGGMYTYVGRGLGSFSGWLMAWAFCSPSPSSVPLCSRVRVLWRGVFSIELLRHPNDQLVAAVLRPSAP